MSDKCAIYVRVSTDKQEVENQIGVLKRTAKVRSWDVVGVFSDEAVSGRRGSRPQLDKMKEMIKVGDVTVVLIWKLDRMGRSVPDLLNLIEFYNKYNCQLVSHTDGVIDTTTASGKMFFQMMAVLAEFESNLIAERTKLSYEYKKQAAKKIGKKVRWGRQERKLTDDEMNWIRVQKDKGLGWRPITTKLNEMRKERKAEPMSFNTVMRAYKRQEWDEIDFDHEEF